MHTFPKLCIMIPASIFIIGCVAAVNSNIINLIVTLSTCPTGATPVGPNLIVLHSAYPLGLGNLGRYQLGL